MRRATRSRPLPAARLVVLALAALLALGWLAIASPPAVADGPTSFSNTAAIAVPATGSANQTGPGSPYPSTITVAGMTGSVTDVAVTFHDLTHGTLNDVDAMVVAPGGVSNLVVLSDVGDPNQLVTITNQTLTFDDDAAAGGVPAQVAVPSGTYRPTNTNPGGAADLFPAPAPAPSSQTTLAGAFTGLSTANGTWSLYVVDDATGDSGTMAGGWSLEITTAVDAASTTTTVSSSDTATTTGDPVTFTAAVRADGTAVTTGTVQFSSDGVDLSGPRPLNGSGNATVTTSALPEGTHVIRAVYSGATGFLSSNGTVDQRVDNATVVAGTTFCNTGAITGPGTSAGAAAPYASNIFVTGLPGQVTKVTASLKGLSQSAPIDFDVLLSGPAPARNVILLSDAGGQDAVSDLTVDVDDAAAGAVPNPLVSGTFRPTDLDPDNQTDTFPAPAPALSGATALSTFDGASANGTWSLWVVDDAQGDAGSLSGGWCLTITSQSPTVTALTAAPNPSAFGQPVAFTANVTTGGSPVTTGTVQFADGGTAIGGPVPVVDGAAPLSTATLSVGSHAITATYSGTADLTTSVGNVTQVVNRAATTTDLTSSVNPSDVGELVTFTATVTSGGTAVTSGAVQFAVDGTDAGAPRPVDGSGSATFATDTLTAGTHEVTAVFGATATLGTSDDDLDQVVARIATQTAITSSANPSQVGESVTLTATVTDPDGDPLTAGTVQFFDDGSALGPAVTVAADGTATFTTASLAAGTHPVTATFVETPRYAESASAPVDQVVGLVPTTTVLTSAPNPSDVGQGVTFTATVTVTAGAAPVIAGTVQFSDDGTALAPPVTVDANGVATLTLGSLAAGTHPVTATFTGTTQFAAGPSNTVDQVVARVVSSTELQSLPDPSDPGEQVTFTAIVTDPGGDPVTTGVVAFTVDGIPVDGGPVVVDPSGSATFSTTALAPGTSTVTATYAQNDTYLGSADTLDHVVRPIAEANGSYAVAEGGGLTLDATGSTDGATFAWDLNGDDDFTDATGAAPSLTWAQLEDLGIDDGPSTHTVTLRVAFDGGTADSDAELTVTNTAPATVLTGSLDATVAVPFTIKVGADDPSVADRAALFTYTVDWGDGSPVVRVDGPADPPVTHLYTSAGDYAASFTATDKDGGTGGPTSVTVRVAVAQVVTPSPTTTTADPDDDSDGADDGGGGDDGTDDRDSSLASTGSPVEPRLIVVGMVLLTSGIGSLLVSRRRRLGSPRHRG